MSNVIPQRATASNEMGHFHGTAADVSQLHISPLHNTIVGILHGGHSKGHGGHPC